MAELFGPIGRMYDWLMSMGDPRVADWPLMSSPFPIVSIIAFYIYTVTVLGPKFMKNRQPYPIEPIIIVYNIIMVIASAAFFYYGGQLTYFPPGGKFSLVCEPIDYSTKPESMRLPKLSWWLLLLKMTEFSDTIFFVLRKKFTHISMLHVMHHSMVAWGFWTGLKFGAGGHNAFFPLINLFIHTIMYSYYCLAALGPSVRKYLWWKKYLTILQMVQFGIALVHACIPLFVDCGFPKFFIYVLVGHAVFFFGMFLNFYRRSYKVDNNDENNNNGQIVHKNKSNQRFTKKYIGNGNNLVHRHVSNKKKNISQIHDLKTSRTANFVNGSMSR
ncbi:hypothetical protein RDWZM_004321 [Blomia tropicalis]|uniref:Elongation of very long chain fatty acids protein n=1 Tax=Blomia tropicalis TaxID=40697 RepID=A0A9Q0RTT2_BLOTA|nr:Elongation of very long chain fatty acids protein 7 [Blomia tropicalis]KAJ6225776.1 hypothetical protein RDWZM_004321 [Blomia tropicalis]